MITQKGGETFFTRQMKKAKENQIIRLNKVKIVNIGNGQNNKNTFKRIFKSRYENELIADDCSVILRLKKKTKTGNFECAMPTKYKKYFEGGLFSKQRTCYKLQFLGAQLNNKINNNIKNIFNNYIQKNIYIVTFSRPSMSIGYFIIDNYLLFFKTKNKDEFIINKNIKINKSNNIEKRVSVYFIRHAWSCSNLFGYFGALTRLKMPKFTPDSQLSGLGTIQAQLLGYNHLMTDIFKKAKFIGSSVLTRATQTALYAKYYSGNKDKVLDIIPAINETLWQPKGIKMTNELRTFISRTATPIDYLHGEQELRNKLVNIGRDLGNQTVNLNLYYDFYKKIIGNNKQLKKHRNKMAIESTHNIFMNLVLPHLVQKKELKDGDYGVVFGHGRYIQEIAKHSFKLTDEQYYQDIVNEGIYNTGIYKVNYVKYEGEDDWELFKGLPFEKIFPIVKSTKNLLGNKYKMRTNAFNQNKFNKNKYNKIINSKKSYEINNIIKIKNTRLNTLIKNINKEQSSINLTNYRRELEKYMGKNSLLYKMHLNKAVMKEKNKKKGLSLLYYYPKEGSGLPMIPIMLTGQKTGEDKGLLRETWKRYSDLYIGDSEGYRVNQGKYSQSNRNKAHIKSKFNHGCLIDLKKIILKEKLTNEDVKHLQHLQYMTSNKNNMNKLLKQFEYGYKLAKSNSNNKRGLNKNFAKKILSNYINENNKSYINKQKEKYIKDYLPITKSFIDKIQKNGDIKKLNSYAPEFITNLFYNFLYLNTTKNNNLKEMFKANINILSNIYLKNHIEFDSDGKMFYSLRVDLNRSTNVILKINGNKNYSGKLKVNELFKQLGFNNLSEKNFNRHEIKPNRKIIENLSEKTKIPIDNLLILSNIINQGTITPLVRYTLTFLNKILSEITFIPSQLIIQIGMNFDQNKNKFTEIYSDYIIRLSTNVNGSMYPILVYSLSVRYNNGNVSYNISAIQKDFFKKILDLPNKINDKKYLEKLNKEAKKIINKYKKKYNLKHI